MKPKIALGAALWAVWLLSSCSPPTGPGAPAAAAARAETDTATTAELHTALLSPGSDALYAVEGAASGPSAWASAEAGAAKVIEGARCLQAGDRPRGRAPWLAMAASLETAAKKSADAARAHNLDALAAADGAMTAHCEDCHKIYRDAGGGMMADPSR